MTIISAERISLRSPAALCCAIPHLLGFEPERSAVLVWLADGRLILTQRVDLPADGASVESWTRAVWSHRAADIADEVIVVVVLQDGGARHVDLDAVVAAVQDRASRSSVVLRDALVLMGQRWRSLLCTDRSCCPIQGQAIPSDLRVAVASEFDHHGETSLPSRDDVLACLDRDEEGARLVAATGILQRDRVRSTRARERWRDAALVNLLAWTRSTRSEHPPERVAHLLLGLRDIRVRDTFLWDLSRFDREGLRIAQGQLCHLTRQAPPGDTAAVATVTGLVCWLRGDGVRGSAACDRALDDDPHYTLAHLLSVSIGAGLPPGEWVRAMDSLTRESCRDGGDLQPEGGTL